jgi:hypothetical protein
MSTEVPDLEQLLKTRTLGELIELAIHSGEAAPAELELPTNIFRSDGEMWELRFAGESVHLRHRLGLEYISYLLANPRRSVPVVSLYLAVNGSPEPTGHPAAEWEPGQRPANTPWERADSGTPEVAADAPTLAACERRLTELERGIAAAEADGDEAEQAMLEEEREKLRAYLSASSGHHGRLRRLANARERIRKSVSNAITRAITAVSEHHERLGRHLRNSVRLGYSANYDPEQPVEWRL